MLDFRYGFRIQRADTWDWRTFDRDLEGAFGLTRNYSDVLLFGEDIIGLNRPECPSSYVGAVYDHYGALTAAGELWLRMNTPAGAEILTSYDYLQCETSEVPACSPS